MNKIIAAIALILVVGGALTTYLSYSNIVPQLTPILTKITEAASTIYQLLTSLWLTIPETVRALIIGGIPLLFAGFFAWTKNRAMQKIETMEQTVNKSTTELSQAKTIYENQLSAKETEIKTLTTRLTNEQTLKTKLDETKLLLAQKESAVTTLQKALEKANERLQNTPVKIVPYVR